MYMGIKIAHYGEERPFNATDEEVQIFHVIREMFPDEKIIIVRKSSNYLSAVCHSMDIARFKFTKKAKWIQLPYVLDDKVKLTDPEDIRQIRSDLERAIAESKKF